ncbi:MAG: alpha/beta hydrolase, partial [Acidimicrobiia bacterium]|nr:alpha/beta hydrolase [Acidimicrobiia bacterium]
FPLPDRPDATMAYLADDIAGLIDEVGHEGALLLGESFGGALGLHVALRHPELVKGLVIVNSFPYLDNRLQLLAAPRLLRLIPWGAMPLARRFTEHRIHSAHVGDDELLEFRQRTRSIERNGYIRRMQILHGHDVRNDLQHIKAPTLFLAGTEDRLVPSARWATYMGERVPDAEVILLKGYGHCCLINHDLDVGRIVADWWDRRS